MISISIEEYLSIYAGWLFLSSVVQFFIGLDDEAYVIICDIYSNPIKILNRYFLNTKKSKYRLFWAYLFFIIKSIIFILAQIILALPFMPLKILFNLFSSKYVQNIVKIIFLKK